MAFIDHLAEDLTSHLGLENATLYRNIQAFSLDAIDAAYPLSRRLSRENRWTPRYTQRAIEEYKKFVFLAVVAGHPVTPSVQVDQVWHLHLIYTRSYWDDFCPKVLGQSLHHGPTKGGLKEDQKYLDWYEKNLNSYEKIFGYPAPIDIWTSPDRRFGEDLKVERVNVQTHWVIPKGWLGRVQLPSFQRWPQQLFQFIQTYRIQPLGISFDRQLLWLASSLMLSLTLAGCSAIVNPLAMKGPEFLGFYAQLIVFGLIWGYFWRWFSRVNSWTSTHTDDAELKPYEMAYLVGQEKRVIDLAVISLVKSNLLVVSADGELTPIPNAILPTRMDPVERSVFQCIGPGKTLDKIRKSSFQRIDDLQSHLVNRNLLLTEQSAKGTRVVTSLIAWGLLTLGIIRCGNGVLNGRPVGYLIAMLIGLVLLASGLWVKPRRTRDGDRRVEFLQQNFRHHFRPEMPDFLLMGFALYGASRLTDDPALAGLVSIMIPSSNDSSDSSGGCSGGGCGGGGCGGGGCGG